ncbi:MAG: hypothetical protein WAM60_22965 [Candidatus Promineifilaceae bacterium]
MSYRDDPYEYHRRMDEFNREQDRQYEYQREDRAFERRQQERDREMGWEAARNNDTFNAIRGLAGAEWALRYNELTESSRSGSYSPLPEPKLTFESLHFYEGDYQGVKHSKRIYQTFFPQSTTRYIYFEVSCTSNRDFLEHTHKMVAKIRKPDRSETEVEWEARSKSGWAESWHTHGWGWAKAGNWMPGVYSVEILIDDEKVGQAYFGIYQDKDTEIPKFFTWKPEVNFALDSDFSRYFNEIPED